MKRKKDFEISFFIVGCILMNYVGKMVAEKLALPIWLDSVGTVFTAYVFGPVCGAIVGRLPISFTACTLRLRCYTALPILLSVSR